MKNVNKYIRIYFLGGFTMSNEIIDVPAQEITTPVEAVAGQPASQPNPQEQIQIMINNELRFAEETIIRALRSAVVNVVNTLQGAGK
jgi:hypothetical protein